MSYKNPTRQQVLDSTTGGDYWYEFHKAACKLFYCKHKRKPTLADAQELRDMKVKGYLKAKRVKHQKSVNYSYDNWYAQASMDGSLAYNGVTDDF